jgi:hypothetical protein
VTKTPTGASTPVKLAMVLVVAALAGACTSSSTNGTASSPSRLGTPSAVAPGSPSPPVVTGAFGVLATSPTGGTYKVSLVGVDARVIASEMASSPDSFTCPNGAAAVVPTPVSTSNTRVYFMDAQGVVRFLSPNGDTGRSTTLPIGPNRRSMFAVSPDDQRIAVIVVDFTSSGASTRLYVEDLNGGGHHLDPFSDSGAFTLWATGWHGTNNLVVEKMPACSGPTCCGDEFHVVDPNTAVRRFVVGGPTCKIAGPPTPAGVVCETDVQANVVTWTATTTRSFALLQGFTHAYLSPAGSLVALWSGNDTLIQESNRTFAGMLACGWIDDTHLLSASDQLNQPRVGNVTTGEVLPVLAQGYCAGRIPGGL